MNGAADTLLHRHLLVFASAGMLAGALLGGRSGVSPLFFGMGAVCCGIAVAVCWQSRFVGLLLLADLLLASSFAAALTLQQLTDPLQMGTEKTVHTVYDVVKETGNHPQSHTFQVRLRNVGDRPVPPYRISLTVTGKARDLTAVGDRIEATVRFNLPQSARNPGDRAARDRLYAQGVAYTGYQGAPGRLVDHRFTPQVPIVALRLAVQRYAEQHWPGETGAFLVGLLFGGSEGLDAQTQADFYATGVSHVLAVSGAQVSILIGLGWLLLRPLGQHRWWSVAILGSSLALYVAMTGGQPSVVRAATMAMILIVEQGIGRRPDSLNVLAVTLIAMLVVHPLQVLDAGFLLSYLATLGLILLAPRMADALRGWPHWMADVVAVTVTAQVAVLPFAWVNFHQWSWAELPANLLLVPLVEAATPLALLALMTAGLPPLSFGLASVAGILSHLFLRGIEMLSRWTHPMTVAAGWAWAGAYVFVMAVLFGAFGGPPAMRKRIGIAGLVLLLLLPLFPWHSSRLTVVFLDVGQGDAALLILPGGAAWLIDGGGTVGASAAFYDIGASTVVPALRALGVQRLAGIVATHNDADHIGGLPAVMRSFPVAMLVSGNQSADSQAYRELYEVAHAYHIPYRRVSAGDHWRPAPNTEVDVFTPFFPPMHGTAHDENNNGVTFRLRFGAISFFFAADIAEEAEAKLVEEGVPQTTVLKVAHHGSASSSSEAFLQRMAPQAAVISVGAHNRYGHPTQAALQRLAATGAHIYRTDQEGAIRFETDGQRAWVTTQRSPATAHQTIGTSARREPFRSLTLIAPSGVLFTGDGRVDSACAIMAAGGYRWTRKKWNG
ncbi:MAG: DNA internalization-related competence protein ComEC/Rec2 [Firmicutes bacterium]|nr:DNA internalization-related competence protein ComEC/Rec2 [Bacillota bacterium]